MGIVAAKLLTNIGSVRTAGLEENRYGTEFKTAGYATEVPKYRSPAHGNTYPNANKLAKYHVPGLIYDRYG